MKSVEVEDLKMVYHSAGSKSPVKAIQDVTFDVDENEFICVIGPTGCGKTTLLNLIAGFIKPTSGVIKVKGKTVERPGPDRGVVFQTPALFPWLDVRGNVEFGLKEIEVPNKERSDIVNRNLDLVGLKEFKSARVHELSGGMKQRVAIARVLSLDPDVLLMDEPFGALDVQTRQKMQTALLNIWEEARKTVIFVTHYVDEAAYLADRVIVFTSRPAEVKRIVDINLQHPRARMGEDLIGKKRILVDELETKLRGKV